MFLGRIGGDTYRLYGCAIRDVSMVRPAVIRLIHEPGRWRVSASTFVEVRSTVGATTKGPVSCRISGHVPGTELLSDVFVVAAPPHRWNLRGRSAFESSFDYSG